MRTLAPAVCLVAVLAGVNGASNCFNPNAGRKVYQCEAETDQINLDGCGLTDADLPDLAVCLENAGWEFVREIYLVNSGIINLPADVFQNLGSLQALYLIGNKFSGLDASMFSNLASLQTLSIYGCALTSLPDGIFDGLGALRILDLHDNDLSSLSAGLLGDDLVSLERLDLRQNSLETIPTSAFQNLPALTTLNLSWNKLSALAPNIFPGSLKQLYLRSNELGLGALDPGTFGGLAAVETLTLTNNTLGSLPAGLFDGLASLTVLGLAENDGLQCLPSTADSPSLAADKLILPSGFAAGGVCPCPGVEVCDDCLPGLLGYVCTGCGEKAGECEQDRTCRECRIPASNSEEEAKWDACLDGYEFAGTCSGLSATACCFDELSDNDCLANDAFVGYSTCLVQAVSENECASLSCRDAGNSLAFESRTDTSAGTDERTNTSGGRRLTTGLGCAMGASVTTGLCVAAGVVAGL